VNDHRQQRIRTAEPAFHNISEKLLSFELGMLLLDLDVDAAQASDAAQQSVPWVDRAHTGRCAGKDQVAGLQCPGI